MKTIELFNFTGSFTIEFLTDFFCGFWIEVSEAKRPLCATCNHPRSETVENKCNGFTSCGAFACAVRRGVMSVIQI